MYWYYVVSTSKIFVQYFNYYNLLFHRENYANSPIPDVKMFGVLPWFHAYGCLTLLSVACSGVSLVYLPKFEDRAFLAAIEVCYYTFQPFS